MKILKKDFKKGYVRLEIQNQDDLWYLSYVIDNGDVVGSQTERKIKIGGDDDRKAKVSRKKLWLEVICEKVDFSKTTGDLRINGKIREGKEDVSAGDYHSLDISTGSHVTIEKRERSFLEYQKDKIEESAKNISTNTLVSSIDRGEALIARLKKYGYEIIAELRGDVEKKDFNENIKKEFFKEIAEKINEISEREKFTSIVIGTIPFWAEKVKQEISQRLDNSGLKVIYTVCSSSGENAIREMMSKEEVKSSLKEERFTIESTMINELLSKISRSENVEYGVKATKKAANMGAVERLLVTDGTVMKRREESNFQEVEDMMRAVDTGKGNVVIVSSEHDAGKQLDGLGGVAAFLRFKI